MKAHQMYDVVVFGSVTGVKLTVAVYVTQSRAARIAKRTKGARIVACT